MREEKEKGNIEYVKYFSFPHSISLSNFCSVSHLISSQLCCCNARFRFSCIICILFCYNRVRLTVFHLMMYGIPECHICVDVSDSVVPPSVTSSICYFAFCLKLIIPVYLLPFAWVKASFADCGHSKCKNSSAVSLIKKIDNIFP
jgi:hypothetical protein